MTSPALTVHVIVDPADADLASALGWSGGVPGAEVRLNRNGTATWQPGTADASGTIVFEGLLPGRYRVYAGRRLTTAEAQAAGGVRALGDGRTFDFPQASAVTLELYGDRPEQLLISEIHRSTPPAVETGGSSYFDGLYFEVYNNSAETIYLDGLAFGLAYPAGYQESAHTPCTISQAVRSDASAIHGRWFLTFPGSGVEYPIMPGEAKVIAQAAIDHTPAHPDLLDLRNADFEIGGQRSGDNPAVPNMLDVGLEPWFPSMLLATSHLYFLSEPLEPHALPIAWRDTQGRGYVRVAAGSVIDAVAFFALWPEQDREAPPCIPMAAPVFERYEGGLFEIGFGAQSPKESLQRRALRMEFGRTILQNANTSAVDFVFASQTPGWIP